MITPADLRNRWVTRQALDGSARSPAEVVRRGGWLPSAGGAGPYLAVRARIGAANRSDVDDAVFRLRELREVLTVRGTTMLVPAEDVPLALALGKHSTDERLRRVAKACGFDAAEVVRLAAQVADTLAAGAASTEDLRARIPEDAIRDLGAAGRKLGEPSMLGVALRELQMSGDVVRLSLTGRLDQPSFAWRIAEPPIRPLDSADVLPLMARRFLQWGAPVSVDDFAWWSGVPKRVARQAFDESGARPVAVEGEPAPRFEPAGTDEISGLAEPPADRVFFLPFRDNLLGLHRGVEIFTDDGELEVLGWNSNRVPAASAESLHQNAIVRGGRVIGAWEFDPDADTVVYKLWDRPRRSDAGRVDRDASLLGTFIREQLGDARFYPFDSAKTRAPRIAFCAD